MKSLCQELHFELAKLKIVHEQSRQALREFNEEGTNPEELEVAIDELTKAVKKYETYCKTAQELPDGTAIWMTDYLALVNLAQLNRIYIPLILDQIKPQCIDVESRRLITLELSHDRISALGDSLLPLGALKKLALTSPSLEDLGNSLDGLVNLQRLDFLFADGFKELGNSLDNLISLRTLCLFAGTGLNGFGNSLRKLHKLQNLYLFDGNGFEEFGDSFDNLANLQNLSFIRCNSITGLGTSLDKLQSLQTLGLYECKKLEDLGSFVGLLPNLTSVAIKGCDIFPESEKQRVRSIPNCKLE